MIDDCDPERFFQTSKPDPLCGVLSEQTEDAQFGAEALVAVELGVGVAFFVDEGELGAEAEEGQGAVEGGEAEGLGEVLAFFGSEGQVGPVGLVEGAGDGGRRAEAEAEGQGVGSGEAAPGSRGAMRTQFGFFLSITGSEAQGKRRGDLPASGEREVPAGAVEVFGSFVASFVPARSFEGHPMRAEALRAFEAQTVFHVGGLVARPMLAAAGE